MQTHLQNDDFSLSTLCDHLAKLVENLTLFFTPHILDQFGIFSFNNIYTG